MHPKKTPPLQAKVSKNIVTYKAFNNMQSTLKNILIQNILTVCIF